MKFQICHRAGRASDRFPIHTADKADQRPGVWEVTEDIVSLVGNFGALDFNEANVVSSRFKTDLAKPVRIEVVSSAPFQQPPFAG